MVKGMKINIKKTIGRVYNFCLRCLNLISPTEFEIRGQMLEIGQDGIPGFLEDRYRFRKPHLAVHVHLYYVEQWPELMACLCNIKPQWRDLFVTLTKDDPAVEQAILAFDPSSTIKTVENCGFDLGPFIDVVNNMNLDDYDYIVKLHTKRTVSRDTYLNCYRMGGTRWKNNLLSFVKTERNFLKTLACFEMSDKVGMIGAEKCIMTNEKEQMDAIFAMDMFKWLDLGRCRKEFVAGTMFIVRAPLLKVFQNKVQLKDFAPTVRVEVTPAHGFERALGYLVSFQGKELLGTDLRHNLTILIGESVGRIKRFFFQSGITRTNHRYIKIFKILVYRKKIIPPVPQEPEREK